MAGQPEDRAVAESTWARRKRLAAIFGDALPDTTSDERDPGSAPAEDAFEAWLKAQVPPHHG
ncbi:hypothetical protein [Nocardioides sp.]|uniref:hypothetical protein n=1 Tax=Nocardioides sp. TaxID=35761 RepID=UPI00286D1BFA|nr:hypothetical protein [Nocardioides sp.]